MKTPFLITTVLIFSGTLLNVFALAKDNPYYANDLDAAVHDAEKNPSNMKFVGNRWYNRSTSKSFNFPKLMNAEMSSEIVDGALDATAAGPGDVAPERSSPLELNAEDVIANKQDDSELDFLGDSTTTKIDLSIQPIVDIEELAPSVFIIDKIEYSSGNYSGSATNIRGESSSRAYITPEP